MIEAETVRLIRWHAGLDTNEIDAASVSGSVVPGAGVGTAVTSFIDALQRLNVELNGARPSEAIDTTDAALPGQMVYAIAEVSRLLREMGDNDEAWAAETAWLAVLAGDIDDVQAHVALERTARD